MGMTVNNDNACKIKKKTLLLFDQTLGITYNGND